MRQPVIILQRGRRADVAYSVFPLYHAPGETWPRVQWAMFHGSKAECEEWIRQRDGHVVLYGSAYESSDWTDQHLQYSRLVAGRPLPVRCMWRPPEEREQELRERTANELELRERAVVALRSLADYVSSAIVAVVLDGSTCDEAGLTAAYRAARNAVGRHTDAHRRLAELKASADG